ncbi:YcaO-like family protein [Terriglobus sp. 2YAB30_2]|uniref:YcaO-like family protein n=1 Tax=Terriglobus sp. 2YAB30_2 TaxID=3233023 RepID=UPI003F99C0D0
MRLLSIQEQPGLRFASVSPGIGSGIDRTSATVPALGEALERLCLSVFHEDQFVLGSANDLGEEEVFAYRDLPACSQEEYADPSSPVRPFDPDAQMRWVKGLDLHTGRSVLIPAIMVYLHAGFSFPGERFWLPNTSGAAAHLNFEQAIWAAICELIERDILSLTWLLQIPLRQIRDDSLLSETSRRILGSTRLDGSDRETFLFDATSDIGVPCIFGLQIAPHSQMAHMIVSCSCNPLLTRAIEKVLFDLNTFRQAFKNPRKIPRDIREFAHVMDGATYMARKENGGGFSFLFNNTDENPFQSASHGEQNCDSLSNLLQRLKTLGMNVYAVDISTDEAFTGGVRVVRVIIPQLQPISFHYRARFLAHTRLTSLHQKLRPNLPITINPAPSPFA